MAGENVHIDDSSLAERIRKDDKSAFKMLYDRYSRKVYYFSLKYLSSNVEAEELVQIIFIKLWEARYSLDGGSSVKSYIYKAAVNHIYNCLKRRKIHDKFVEAQTTGSDSRSENLYEEIFFHDLEESIDAAVKRLPEQQQRIFRLSRYDGFSYPEIASRLGLSVRTVENQAFRALRTLKAILQKRYFIP